MASLALNLRLRVCDYYNLGRYIMNTSSFGAYRMLTPALGSKVPRCIKSVMNPVSYSTLSRVDVDENPAGFIPSAVGPTLGHL